MSHKMENSSEEIKNDDKNPSDKPIKDSSYFNWENWIEVVTKIKEQRDKVSKVYKK